MRFIFIFFVFSFILGCSNTNMVFDRFHKAVVMKNVNEFRSVIDKYGIIKIESIIGGPVLCILNGPEGVDSAEMTEVAIAAGANVNARLEGETPLMIAATWLRVENAKILLASGADLGAQAQDGKRAFELIASGGNEQAIKELHTLLDMH